MYSVDPNKLYTSSHDGTIFSYDLNTKKAVKVFEYKGHEITHFDMNPTGQIIYFSTDDGLVGTKDLRSTALRSSREENRMYFSESNTSRSNGHYVIATHGALRRSKMSGPPRDIRPILMITSSATID